MPQADLFSMEKYAAGFIEACEQVGIDPVQLVKLAQAVQPRQDRRGPGRAVPMTPEQKQYGRAYSPALARDTQDEAQRAGARGVVGGMLSYHPVGMTNNAARAGWQGMQSVSNEDYRRNPLRALGKSVQRGATGAWGAAAQPFKDIGSGAGDFWGGLTGAPEGGAAPQQAAAPQQQMNPNYEQWRQEALGAGQGGGGGDFYDRVQQAEQQFGGRYDQRLAQAPRRRWWEHAPKPAAGGQSSVWSGMAQGTASPAQGMAQAKQDLATQQARKVKTPQYLRAPKV